MPWLKKEDHTATIDWVAAIRIVERALVDYSESLSKDDAVALQRAWDRIQQG
jgi:hypothetical protein